MLRRIGGAVAVALSLSGAFLVSTGPAGASTSGPPPAPRAAAPIGYWLAAGDGGVFAFDVPFFVLDGRFAVPGAQPPDVLLRLLNRVWDSSGEPATAGPT